MLYPLIRTLFDRVPATPQVLTFVSGQVVKGEVQKILPDDQAVIRFGQHVIRAVADAPLEVGRTSWFQVLSVKNPITLKFLAEPVPQRRASHDLGPLLSHLKLNDGPLERSVLQLFVREGLPMTKDNVHQALQVLRQTGVQGNHLEVVKAALLRGVPLTPETVHALREFMFGAPLHQRLQQLNQQLPAALQIPIPRLEIQSQADGIQLRPGGQAALTNQSGQLHLSQGQSLQQALSQEQRPALQGSGTNLSQAFPQASAASSPTANGTLPGRMTDQPAVQHQPLLNQPQGTAMERAPLMSTTHAVQQAGTRSAPVTLSFSTQSASGTLAGDSQLQQQIQQGQSTSALLKTGEGGHARLETAASHSQQNNPVYSFLKWLGIGHEKEVKSFIQSAARGEERAPLEINLKSELQSLLKRPEVTSNVREQVQSTLHYITGQQLFIQDHSAQHMHLLLFQLPVNWLNQEHVVYGQLQGFKKKGKQIDASNCRLLFYLQLQNLGELCVDLQIQNKTLSVVCYNDTIGVEKGNEWLSASFETLQQSLADAGYHLSNLKWKEGGERQREASPAKQYPLMYYRGVDVRV